MKNEKRVAHLRSVIDRADQAYYNTDTPILEDAQYDVLKEELKKLVPDDERHARVGAPVPPISSLEKFKHTCFVGSLFKCDDVSDFTRWYSSSGDQALLAAYKYDGATGVAYYEDGKLIRFVTRGGDDGVGEDITANAIQFEGMCTNLPLKFTGAIRGECIMYLDNWRIADPSEHSNPRNIGNGIMRRMNGQNSHLITFIAFDIEDQSDGKLADNIKETVTTEALKLMFLNDLGFRVTEHQLCRSLGEAESYLQSVEEKRPSLSFWIDGVVFKVNDLKKQAKLGIRDNRPKGQVVRKFEAEGATTVLEGVELTVGHTGYIIPTGKLKPVRLGGTTVSSALLNNFQEIKDLDVAIGDTVRVIKAKDIIPKVIEVVERPATRKEIKEPCKCPACGGEAGRRQNTDGSVGAITECKNADECSATSLAKIKSWIKKTGIKGIGGTMLVAIVERFDMESPADLYRIEVDDLAAVVAGTNRIGASRAKQIVEEIEKTKTLTLNLFVGSLGVQFLGRRKTQLIREAVPGEFDTLEDWRSRKLEQRAGQAGVKNIAPAICDGIDKMSDTIDDLLNYVTISEDKKVAAPKAPAQGNSKIAGKTFVFTGKVEHTDDDGNRLTRDSLHDMVLENGGSTSSRVAGGVDYLVQADPSSQSSKTQKANKLGIDVISIDDFLAMVG